MILGQTVLTKEPEKEQKEKKKDETTPKTDDEKIIKILRIPIHLIFKPVSFILCKPISLIYNSIFDRTFEKSEILSNYKDKTIDEIAKELEKITHNLMSGDVAKEAACLLKEKGKGELCKFTKGILLKKVKEISCNALIEMGVDDKTAQKIVNAETLDASWDIINDYLKQHPDKKMFIHAFISKVNEQLNLYKLKIDIVSSESKKGNINNACKVAEMSDINSVRKFAYSHGYKTNFDSVIYNNLRMAETITYAITMDTVRSIIQIYYNSMKTMKTNTDEAFSDMLLYKSEIKKLSALIGSSKTNEIEDMIIENIIKKRTLTAKEEEMSAYIKNALESQAKIMHSIYGKTA